MKSVEIIFPDDDITIKATLLENKAPLTCRFFWEAIENTVEILGRHAMYTGKEISTQLPNDICENLKDYSLTKENATCFPSPGNLLFTYVPSYEWGGNPKAIYDVGLFYGEEGRTFFPLGWLPGNCFAKVDEDSMEDFREMGRKILIEGEKRIIFERND